MLGLGGPTPINLTPGLWIPGMAVGKPKSVKAVRGAIESKDFLFCVSLSDPLAKDSKLLTDFAPIGGICNIHALLDVPEQNLIKVQLEVKRMAKLLNVYAEDTHLAAEVEELDSEPQDYKPTQVSFQTAQGSIKTIALPERLKIFGGMLGSQSHVTLPLNGRNIELKFDPALKKYSLSDIKQQGTLTLEYTELGEFVYEGDWTGRRMRESIGDILIEEITNCIG